jgi:peptidoglycan/LPS O-acetylase OafA/YrhL
MERLAGMKRLECLDGLRGLLAVYVLLGHMAPFAVLPRWMQIAVSHGGAAVDVFFVLSGLVITQSLLHAGGQAKPFLIARATRIFPVFLPVFALAVVVDPWSCGFDRMPWIGPENAARTICVMAEPRDWLLEVMAHLTMTHGLFPNGVLKDVWVSFLGSAWSLSTEWQFYLLALLAAGLCRRLWRLRAAGLAKVDRWPVVGGTRTPVPTDAGDASVIRPQTLCWILLGLAAAGVAWRIAGPEAWQFSRAFLPNKGHFFALGIASVPVVRQERGALFRYGLVLAATLAICATQDNVGKMLPPLAWTACLAVQMLPRRTGTRLAGRVLRSSAAQYLGAISYCVYLVNEPIHKVLASALSDVAGADATLFTLLWVPTAVGLPILAAIWLHAHVETPALRWGRAAGRASVLQQEGGPLPSVQARRPGL